LNTTIDQHFVPVARVDLPGKGEFDDWRSRLQNELRRVCFRGFPERIPAARVVEESNDLIVLETEPGIRVRLFLPQSEPSTLSPAIGTIVPGNRGVHTPIRRFVRRSRATSGAGIACLSL
jgi:hypothetical protein